MVRHRSFLHFCDIPTPLGARLKTTSPAGEGRDVLSTQVEGQPLVQLQGDDVADALGPGEA